MLKLGGEMVSLSEVETVAAKIWPSDHHAAISMTINSLEAIILFTTKKETLNGKKSLIL